MSKLLILTVGLPRSGKSTWAKCQGQPIVNRDAIRLALHGKRFLAEAEEMVTAIENIMVRALFEAGHNVVIVDATHTTIKRRERWVSKTWKIKTKVFSIDMGTCIKRAIAQGDKEIIPHIKRMSAQIDIKEGDIVGDLESHLLD